ncbi:MAG: FAD-dependent oxidoreductase [Acidimicrobiia bacterium]|nr:FAD-dependent oxidoreductase [Acidimicrobiia bacterium]
MSEPADSADVIVVGAGMAGLTAARELKQAGVSTLIVDKGRAPGGRMATRTINGARFDHGAQHFSARSAEFRSKAAELQDAGVVRSWYEADSRTTPGLRREPRLVGVGGMRRIPEHLADGLDVRMSITIDRLHWDGSEIIALAGNTPIARGSAIILTLPVPQLINLLGASDTQPSTATRDHLGAVSYNPSFAVMATLDAPGGLQDGHLAGPTQDVAWIADNQHKGTSELPAVTIHSTADYAAAHLDADRDQWTDHLANQVAPILEGRIIDAVGHRWMYAEPRTTFDSGAIALDSAPRTVLAGEVFAGAKVEGAFLSGLAAAGAVLEMQ